MSQVLGGSQATSYMTLGGLVAKKMEEALRIPVTRSCQRADPLVCERLRSVHASVFSRRGTSYVIIHDGSSKQENSCIIGPLYPVDVAAVEGCMGAVVEMVVLVHQANSLSPVERLLGPLRISVISGIQGQTSTQIEETTVGN